MHINYEVKKSIRGAIGDELASLGAVNPDIVVLDADLSGSTKTSTFAKVYPDRFFDVGIAEQNLITTSLGLSLTGKIPFAATFAVFATGRVYDQIRNSVCYQKANVKIIGAHGGITVGEDGASHQALEDISLMRGLPNMTVIAPGDYAQARWAVKYAASVDTPVYIRSSRIDVPCVFEDSYEFRPDKAITLKMGTDLTILATGDILSETVREPLDCGTIIKSAEKTGLVVTVEDHSVIGGLGSAVSELLSEQSPHKVIRFGIEDTFGQSGTPKELLKYYGLDAESIANRIIELKQ